MSAWTESSPNPNPNANSDPNPAPGSVADSVAAEARVCDGVYSVEQAQRGQKTFVAQCAQCHGANIRGGFGVASLVGPAFTSLWGDKPLWSLFDKMKSTMPLDSAGALSDQSYIELMARILEINGFPASDDSELPLQQDELEQLTVPKECPER